MCQYTRRIEGGLAVLMNLLAFITFNIISCIIISQLSYFLLG